MIKLLKKLIYSIIEKPVIYNVNNSNHSSWALVSYIKAPFIVRRRQKDTHQNIWQVIELAKILDNYGFNVDAVDYNLKKSVKFRHKYDLLIEIEPKDSPIYQDWLNPECTKIAYMTGRNPLVSNSAEKNRLKYYTTRHGKNELHLKRQAALLSGSVEEFDAFFLIGNEPTLDTYKMFDLPKKYLIPNTGYNFGVIPNDNRRKNNFVFFSGYGVLHKGLDLLLDVFAQADFPCKLFVCANIDAEPDVKKEWDDILHNNKNIEYVGFLDIWSTKFLDIMEQCCFSILPSCAEGIPGSVLTTMSAGVIPICSKECSFSADEVILLDDCSIECIKEKVLECSGMDEITIKNYQDRTKELVQGKYSCTNFVRSINAALDEILNN